MQFIHVGGRLAKDPEVRYTSSGQKVTTLVIPVNSKRGGNEETTWYRVSLWGEHWDKFVQYLKKGSGVLAGGELRKPEIYTDKNGVAQIGSLEIRGDYVRFAPGPREENPSVEETPQSNPYAQGGAQQGTANPVEMESSYAPPSSQDEPLPF